MYDDNDDSILSQLHQINIQFIHYFVLFRYIFFGKKVQAIVCPTALPILYVSVARLSTSVATWSIDVPRLSVSVARLSINVATLSISFLILSVRVATLSICFHRRSIS